MIRVMIYLFVSYFLLFGNENKIANFPRPRIHHIQTVVVGEVSTNREYVAKVVISGLRHSEKVLLNSEWNGLGAIRVRSIGNEVPNGVEISVDAHAVPDEGESFDFPVPTTAGLVILQSFIKPIRFASMMPSFLVLDENHLEASWSALLSHPGAWESARLDSKLEGVLLKFKVEGKAISGSLSRTGVTGGAGILQGRIILTTRSGEQDFIPFQVVRTAAP